MCTRLCFPLRPTLGHLTELEQRLSWVSLIQVAHRITHWFQVCYHFSELKSLFGRIWLALHYFVYSYKMYTFLYDWKWLLTKIMETGVNCTNIFFFIKRPFFPFYDIKLDRFIVNALFSYITNWKFLGSTSGQCNRSLSSQFSRYCGFYLGLTALGVFNQPICGNVY